MSTRHLLAESHRALSRALHRAAEERDAPHATESDNAAAVMLYSMAQAHEWAADELEEYEAQLNARVARKDPR